MMKQGLYSQPLVFLLKGGKIKCQERQRERGIKNLNLQLGSIIGARGVGELTVISGNLDFAGFVLENLH